jgi:hypothetical protein
MPTFRLDLRKKAVQIEKYVATATKSIIPHYPTVIPHSA